MRKKNIELIFKTYMTHLRQKKTAGFTLIELLMAIVVGSIVMYAMMTLVLSLLGTEKQETAKSQIQQEMSMAMDYIASELQEAVYIYPGDCLNGTAGGTDGCRDLISQSNLRFPAGVSPVLAFWKLEPVPDGFDCNNGEEGCRDLRTSGHTYTLVIYSLRVNDTEPWQGPAQITRYQLRRYQEFSPLTLTREFGPNLSHSDLKTWTASATITTTLQNHLVLVDSVDAGIQPPLEACPATHTRSAVNNTSSFYACVRDPGEGRMQDAIVFLRGNALKRAGQSPLSTNRAYLPSVQRQVQARSVFERRPPSLGN